MYSGNTNVHWTLQKTRGLVMSTALGAVLAVGAVGSALAHAEHGHPARIHQGSCEELGAVAFRLNGVGASVDLDNAPIATPSTVNEETAYQVMVGETTIEGALDEILAEDLAVMIYESDEAMDAIACGNVGGAMLGNSLVTGLAENGHPGHLGFALFESTGGQTVVTVIIGHALAPVTAAGAEADHAHAEEEASHEQENEGDDAHDEQEEGDHDAAATPVA